MAEAISVPVHELLSSSYTKECEKTIRKVPLDLGSIGLGTEKVAYLLKNVFSPEECEALIRKTEEAGYVPALIHSGNYAAPAPGYRDSYRIMIDDKKFTDILFKRIGHHLPQEMFGDKLLEINERLRFLRYRPGDKFAKHYDGSYVRPDGSAETQITLQIYLNDAVQGGGGETTFFPKSTPEFVGKTLPVRPEAGMILVFEHHLLHEGSLVREGIKYTIRTDVLYKIK